MYRQKTPNCLLRIKGMPPLEAIVYNLEVMRCGLCGESYPAPAPDGVGDEKYDYSVAAMIGLMHYGMIIPFYRIAALQRDLGVPLPESTQWGVVNNEAAEKLEPIVEHMRELAAQGEVHAIDDTLVRILGDVSRPAEHGEDRTGLHTTAIVSKVSDHQIALFVSGPNHAGENVTDLLKRALYEWLKPWPRHPLRSVCWPCSTRKKNCTLRAVTMFSRAVSRS